VPPLAVDLGFRLGPLISSRKNGSTPSVRAGRCNARPTILAGAPASARAAALARNPARSAIARIRCRVVSDTPGRPFRA
jgi:hypothetical protein